MGGHIWELDYSKLPMGNEYLFIGEFFGIIGIAIAKTSFCVTLLRLAVHTWHKVLLWVCIVTVNLVMWICGLTFFVSCTPIEKKWNPMVPGTCWDNTPVVNFAVFAGGKS
jgi:hypothetical protein